MALNIIRQGDSGDNRHSIFLYGMPKVGKTTEACKFPHTLALDCEPRGTQFVRTADKLQIKNLSDLEQQIDEILRQPHKTLVVDGITWMLEQAAKTLPERDGRQAYKKVGDRFQLLIGKILSSDKIVVATGHSRKIEDPEKQGKTIIQPDMNPDLADSVFGVFSVVCYCFPVENGASKMLTKPDDNDKRRIMAGDRSGKLPRLMDLSAAKLMEGLGMNIAQSSTPATPAPATENGGTHGV